MATKEEIARWLLNPDNPRLMAAVPFVALEQRITELGLEKVYREIELPLMPILEKMHEQGIKVDVLHLQKLNKALAKELAALEKKIYKAAGEEFNLNSPKQLAAILFKKLQINEGGVGRTKTGAYATDAETLAAIQDRHPILPLILKYRELFKISSTYAAPLLELAGADPTHRIHTTFMQTGTATGRLSSQNPNLQNIPVSGEWAKEVRAAFIAEKGYVLAAFDYSQIELRVLAHVTGDVKMIKAFKDGKDIHAITAANVFNTDLKNITKEQRRFAKTLNFGVIYGMGPQAFARSAGISLDEARRFIEEYFNDFSAIKEWHKEVIADARKKGYVENENGRKRWLPGITSMNRRFSSEAERAAINMPIQGLAADIIKLAMIQLAELTTKEKWGDAVRMLLTIHDELIFEIKKPLAKNIMPRIQDMMERACSLAVPIQVDAHVGKNWAELK